MTGMGGPHSPSRSGPLVLVLHGYGQAPAEARRLEEAVPPALEHSSWQGTLAVSADSWGWFPVGLDPQRRRSAVRGSAEDLLARVDATGHAARDIAVIGFSQGGAIGAHLMRLRPERVRFVVNLSGFVVPADLPGDDAVARRRTPYFWGRGDADSQMSAAAVAATGAWLHDHAALTERVYPGLGHAISDDEVRDARTWMEGHTS